MSYKDTVFLPKTDFSMRGNLPQKEPEILETWKNLYEIIREESKGRKKFIINFGPPYANGNLHIGHALSYILKDIVNKTFQMKGFDAPMIVGWDCHGLPIEWKVEETYRAEGKKKEDIAPLEFRKACREFAAKWVDVQREEQKRWGLIADFDHPYLTMDFHTEGLIVEQIGHFLLNDSLYRSLRPVFWSVVEQTALADSEIEYHNVTSPSIYVAFPVQGEKGLYAVIWTTTPWTIPANRAISYNPELEYVIVPIDEKRYIVAKECKERFLSALGEDPMDPRFQEDDKLDVSQLKCQHPLHDAGYTFDVPLLPGDHVTSDAGTGLVHTAPTHGEDDFAMGKKFNLEMPDIMDDAGMYRDHIPLFAGQHIFKVNPQITAALAERGCLLSETKLEHSYPHSWRSKKPVIYRTTSQWFIDIDKSGIRQKALEAIKDVQWVPKEGYNRIRSMLENRPDWCVSRQRVWGTPITLFIHKQTREPIRDATVHARIVELVKERGGDIWFTEPNATFLGDAYNPDDYEKVMDVVDVWFDSGCVHEIVLKNRAGQQWPADVYLEGSDQHRGWFQSSLLESIGVNGQAPYKAVVTHGFVLDEHGRKMSKSTGNTVAPEQVIKEYGADILRQWVVMSDYTTDLRIGSEILKRQQELYRRFRNTLRYLLGALDGFTPEEAVPFDQMPELEQYVLHQISELCALHDECLKNFELQRFYADLHTFCSNDLSAFYLDIRKDSLYCDAPTLLKRRAARTVMYHLFNFIVKWMAPVLSFTAEEAWRVFSPEGNSVHTEQFSKAESVWGNPDLAEKWAYIKDVRSTINNALEQARAAKVIGSSLEAKVKLTAVSLPCAPELLNELCITSVLEYHPGENDVQILPAPGHKCERCWKVLEEVTEAKPICNRCGVVVQGNII